MAITKIQGVISLVAGDASAAPIYNGTFSIQAIHWDQDDAEIGDQVVVTDAAGNPIFSATSDFGVRGVTLPSPIPATGLIVPTLDAGTVYIYVAGALPQS